MQSWGVEESQVIQGRVIGPVELEQVRCLLATLLSGADIGSRGSCAKSGTGAISQARSRTWRPARCCSSWNSVGG